MFNCSIEENLKLAKPDATDKEMEQALKDANAWEFISTKLKPSGGIKTNVGSMGGKMSGG